MRNQLTLKKEFDFNFKALLIFFIILVFKFRKC